MTEMDMGGAVLMARLIFEKVWLTIVGVRLRAKLWLLRRLKVSPIEARNRIERQVRDVLENGRFYGDGGTIHGTTHVDVETRDGKVLAVWFRCAQLPFSQTEVANPVRVIDLSNMDVTGRLRGVVFDGD